MAKSVLLVYEPLDTFKEKRDYWNSYVTFYERYWQVQSAPHSEWYGMDYEGFRHALSGHLDIDEEALEDCFFIKDEKGRCYICPLSSRINPYILSSEGFIPPEWFILFKGEERKFFYTHTGFGTIHYDGIYYGTEIALGLERFNEAEGIIEEALRKQGSKGFKSPIFYGLSEIQSGIRNLGAWLSGFDRSGKVILNYGEICSFIHPYTLKNEHSVVEIWQMLDLINKDQIGNAELLLNVITQKWDDINRKASRDIDKPVIQ